MVPPEESPDVTSVAADYEWLRVETPDGRALETLVAGPAGGLPLVFHSGTPSAATPWPLLFDLAAQRGLRTVTLSRPGYAASSPRPGRSVADVAADVGVILDQLGAGAFVTLGWSGGGPHAAACAALLPDRCLAAALLASVAPYPAQGLDWFAGMGQDNVTEFTVALEGEAAIRPLTLENAKLYTNVQPDEVAAVLGNLVSNVDIAALTGDFAEYLAESVRRSVTTGIEGWIADDLAFSRPWGFDLAAITRPVAVWQGGQDRMVPFGHGEWLASHIPGARPHLYPDEGHLSLSVAKLDVILDDLLELAPRVRTEAGTANGG
jgi:pimeloyl-ACP methyl ester carboxylesterase